MEQPAQNSSVEQTTLSFSEPSPSWYSQLARTKHGRRLSYVALGVALLAYIAYFVYYLYIDFTRNPALLVLTVLVVAGLIVKFVWRRWKSIIIQKFQAIVAAIDSSPIRKYLWLVAPLALVGICVFVVVDARSNPRRLIGASGLACILLISFILSRNHAKVPWLLVVRALVAQLVLGLLILRWQAGFIAVRWLGDQVALFISYTNYGARFVFGDKMWDHWFVMQSMPIAIFIGAVTELLYHYGIIQAAIVGIGTVIQMALGTGKAESFIAAANIFFGPANAAIMASELLSEMTSSELHTVLTVGFATISGGTMAQYISFGVSPSHLVTASVMSAPAALALSKVLIPETEENKVQQDGKIKFQKRSAVNAIEALSDGATGCVKVVGYVTVNMLSFLALIQFLNATLTWLGDRVGMKGLTFQVICSYIFAPLGFLMGAPWADCLIIGQLVGYAIFVNSFFSFVELGRLIRNRLEGRKPSISIRSEALATYAVCNFANIGSLGMNLGAIGALAPTRKADLARVGLWALLGGNMASWMTACVAGLLMQI